MAIIVSRHGFVSREGSSKQVTQGRMSNASSRLGIKLWLRLAKNIASESYLLVGYLESSVSFKI